MKQNKLKVAVTGGIGSGKSTVCKIIEEEGYKVYSCDKTYSELFESGYFTEDFVKAFGSGVLDGDGKLSRENISVIVFSDREKLKELDKITHPAIFKEMFLKSEKSGESISFYEVPLLFEGGYESLFDRVIVVTRPETERIKSVMQRDNLSESDVTARLKNQINYKNKGLSEYYVIHNDGKIDDLKSKITNILIAIEKEANSG